MRTRHNLPKQEFSGQGCRAVIVGVHTETSLVEKIWLHENGNMILGPFVDRPQPGRTAIGEAITLFGLTKVRQFPATEFASAKAYEISLKIELSEPPLS